MLRTGDPISLTGDLALHDDVAGDHALTLIGKKLRVAEAPLPMIGSGKLIANDISLKLRIAGTILKPDISGNVGIRGTDFRTPDTLITSKPSFGLPMNPRFHIAVEVAEDVRITSAQLSATVRTLPGEPIIFSGDLSHPAILGSLIIDKGGLNFPTARFVIVRGGTVSLRYPAYAAGNFMDPILGITLDVSATTHMIAASMNGVTKRYTITVEARGPINMEAPLNIGAAGQGDMNLTGARGLTLNFRSDPPDLAISGMGMQQRITGLLGGQDAIQSLFGRNPDLGKILSNQVTDILSNSFIPDLMDRLGIGKALGFEELSVEYNRLDSFSLRISRQLFGPIYLSYWRQLSGTGQTTSLNQTSWEFKLSYRIRPNFQFSWTADDQRTNAYLLEGVYKF